MRINFLGLFAYLSVTVIEMHLWQKFSPETYGTAAEWAFWLVLTICAYKLLRPWEEDR